MPQLPESLNIINKEFITLNNEPFRIKVELVPFSKIENETRLELQIQLSKDLIAQASLDVLGINEPDARLKKFTSCRYGGFDDQPDIDSYGIETPEYFNCGERGKCRVEGKLCRHIKVENGYLTPREVEVIKLIAKDLPDKLIADQLKISYNTATTHRTNIQHKLGVHTKVGIARFAVQKNIV